MTTPSKSLMQRSLKKAWQVVLYFSVFVATLISPITSAPAVRTRIRTDIFMPSVSMVINSKTIAPLSDGMKVALLEGMNTALLEVKRRYMERLCFITVKVGMNFYAVSRQVPPASLLSKQVTTSVIASFPGSLKRFNDTIEIEAFFVQEHQAVQRVAKRISEDDRIPVSSDQERQYRDLVDEAAILTNQRQYVESAMDGIEIASAMDKVVAYNGGLPTEGTMLTAYNNLRTSLTEKELITSWTLKDLGHVVNDEKILLHRIVHPSQERPEGGAGSV